MRLTPVFEASRFERLARHSAAIMLLVAGTGVASAQDQQTPRAIVDAPAIVSGEIIECSQSSLSVRTAQHQVLLFKLDDKTYVERENARIPSMLLKTGDTVDIVTDRNEPNQIRYAQLVRIAEAPPKEPAYRKRLPLNPLPVRTGISDHLIPRGRLTYAGLVTKKLDDRLVLRTRSEGEKVIFLRNDTNFRSEGRQVTLADLPLQMQVFVRAGKNWDSEVEAYEVVWGEILTPSSRH